MDVVKSHGDSSKITKTTVHQYICLCFRFICESHGKFNFSYVVQLWMVLPVLRRIFDGHDWRLTSLNTSSSRSCSFTHTDDRLPRWENVYCCYSCIGTHTCSRWALIATMYHHSSSHKRVYFLCVTQFLLLVLLKV